MVARQWYGGRKRNLGLGLCRWGTLEVCWVLEVANAQIRALVSDEGSG